MICCAAIGFGLNEPAQAGTYSVTNTALAGAGSLSNALALAQGDTNAVINVQLNLGIVVLNAPLPAIENNLVLNGNGLSISGANSNRIFFVNAPGATVQISGLMLSDGLAQGGAGGAGSGAGGGGAGLGGAIFLNAGNLTVTNMTFSGNSAKGGAGGIGAMGSFESAADGGGGGGGVNFNGGAGGNVLIIDAEGHYGAGGGGGAFTSAGGDGLGTNIPAGMGGGVNGGTGGLSTFGSGTAGNGGSPTQTDGGGGGGGLDGAGQVGGSGGNGSDFGGGGGSGSSTGGTTVVSGGHGGFGGGGGGGADSIAEFGSPGGAGGFGGGGGGGGGGVVASISGAGGAGGFGAGGGVGGTNGNSGGGLGAGGAIFARAGSTLIVEDSNFGSDTVAGGLATSPATNGSAIGQAIFLGGNTTFSVSSGTLTLGENIGGGNDTNAQGSFTKTGAGTLVLNTPASYTGATIVSNGTLELSNSTLPSASVTINSNAVLVYNYPYRVLSPSITYQGAGTLRAISNGQVVFGPGQIHVNFSAGALIDVQAGVFFGSSSYGGNWSQNEASLNIANGAIFDAVEAGYTGTMQIDALTGGGVFQGGYYGNANHGLTTVTIGVAGGSGTFSGTFQNDGSALLGVVKTGAGTETFSGTSSYSGGTTVNQGTLVVNGTNGPGAVTVTGGFLSGTGTIGGAVSIQTGGTFAPGAPLGTMTISNTLTLAGNTLVSLNSGANSKVVCTGNVNYGGTLTVTNLGGALSQGETFTVFSAASAANDFTNVTGNAGNGLRFVFNPWSGVLSVAGSLPSSPTNVSYSINGGQMKVTWPANYTGWILQAQTNPVTVGISTNWVDVPGTASLDTMSFPISVTNCVFFRMRHP